MGQLPLIESEAGMTIDLDEMEASLIYFGDWNMLIAELRAAREMLETLRLQLAACGVAALSNTEKSSSERISDDNPYWTASYKDVCNAVDREMKLRTELLAAREAISKIGGVVEFGKELDALGHGSFPIDGIRALGKILQGYNEVRRG